ncbi:MAG: hypothetical protein Q7U57_15185, partial [Methylovulum sp.]|nr:hypothetical protein [Methylovulum sp.]
MSVEFKKNQVIFKDVVSVEDAESLLEWLQQKTAAQVDFSSCAHLHSANLQVLMAAKPKVTAWPEDTAFTAWLQSALNKKSVSD